MNDITGFLQYLDRAKNASTIPDVVQLLSEIDADKSLTDKYRTILDEQITLSVEMAIYYNRFFDDSDLTATKNKT